MHVWQFSTLPDDWSWMWSNVSFISGCVASLALNKQTVAEMNERGYVFSSQSETVWMQPKISKANAFNFRKGFSFFLINNAKYPASALLMNPLIYSHKRLLSAGN